MSHCAPPLARTVIDFVRYILTPVNQFGSNVSGSIIVNNNEKEINLNHADKLYLNASGDTLTGDLNLTGNRLYLNKNKKQSIYQNLDDLVFETDDKFMVRNNSNNN